MIWQIFRVAGCKINKIERFHKFFLGIFPIFVLFTISKNFLQALLPISLACLWKIDSFLIKKGFAERYLC